MNSKDFESIKETYPTYSYPHINPELLNRNSLNILPKTNNPANNDIFNINNNNQRKNDIMHERSDKTLDNRKFFKNHDFSENKPGNDEKIEKKTNFARNIKGRLGFLNETPEELMAKEQKMNEYKDYIQEQIEEKKRQKEIEKSLKIQEEMKEESKIRRQLDELYHFSSNDSKHSDQSNPRI